ncbi:MAG: type II toxin-antitoxin system PemK/MazF family toxin [Ruminococcus sp.]|nr:type II toxin-antitoxin system PemK/MazF family toxin [Ruminococcus sp.]
MISSLTRTQPGSIYLARLYGDKYCGRRLVVVVDAVPGVITVVPIRTSQMHRSSISSVVIDSNQTFLQRRISVDCGKVIALRRSSLLRKLGEVTDEQLDLIRRRVH